MIARENEHVELARIQKAKDDEARQYQEIIGELREEHATTKQEGQNLHKSATSLKIAKDQLEQKAKDEINRREKIAQEELARRDKQIEELTNARHQCFLNYEREMKQQQDESA